MASRRTRFELRLSWPIPDFPAAWMRTNSRCQRPDHRFLGETATASSTGILYLRARTGRIKLVSSVSIVLFPAVARGHTSTCSSSRRSLGRRYCCKATASTRLGAVGNSPADISPRRWERLEELGIHRADACGRQSSRFARGVRCRHPACCVMSCRGPAIYAPCRRRPFMEHGVVVATRPPCGPR